jgi:hypothetical protein
MIGQTNNKPYFFPGSEFRDNPGSANTFFCLTPLIINGNLRLLVDHQILQHKSPPTSGVSRSFLESPSKKALFYRLPYYMVVCTILLKNVFLVVVHNCHLFP